MSNIRNSSPSDSQTVYLETLEKLGSPTSLARYFENLSFEKKSVPYMNLLHVTPENPLLQRPSPDQGIRHLKTLKIFRFTVQHFENHSVLKAYYH